MGRGRVGPPGDHELWHIRGLVDGPAGPVRVSHRLTRTSGGSLVLYLREACIRVEPADRTIFVEAGVEGLGAHLVTTYGLPLLLHSTPGLLLHACAAVPAGGVAADVFCARSGTGKSSLLAGLIGKGWLPVTEDVASLDFRRPGEPRIWPGPPWVRTAAAGPRGSQPLFTVNGKVSWDISASQVHESVPLRRIVFLDAPAGSAPAWTPLDQPAAIAVLPQHVAWLADQNEKAASIFGATVQLAGLVPAVRLRLPRGPDWVTQADAILRASAD